MTLYVCGKVILVPVPESCVVSFLRCDIVIIVGETGRGAVFFLPGDKGIFEGEPGNGPNYTFKPGISALI